MHKLWYTAYLVFTFTFLLLAYAEWQIPGFVSQVFPIYLVVLVALICGVASLFVVDERSVPRRVNELIAVALGAVIAILIFHAAGAFGAMRLLLAMISFFIPLLLLKALSDVKV